MLFSFISFHPLPSRLRKNEKWKFIFSVKVNSVFAWVRIFPWWKIRKLHIDIIPFYVKFLLHWNVSFFPFLWNSNLILEYFVVVALTKWLCPKSMYEKSKENWNLALVFVHLIHKKSVNRFEFSVVTFIHYVRIEWNFLFISLVRLGSKQEDKIKETIR